MRPSRYRVFWIASIGFVAILCTYLGQTYLKLRSVEHHLPLVGLSIWPDLDWLSDKVVEYELRRRIENGDFFGADVLSDTLSMGLSREDLRDSVIQRAEWLVADLVDVNSQGMTGLTALHIAVALNDPFMAEQLVRLGADPKVKSRVGDVGDGGLDVLEYAELVKTAFPDSNMAAILECLAPLPSKNE